VNLLSSVSIVIKISLVVRGSYFQLQPTSNLIFCLLALLKYFKSQAYKCGLLIAYFHSWIFISIDIFKPI